MPSDMSHMRSKTARSREGKARLALLAVLGMSLAACANAKIGNVGSKPDSGVNEDTAAGDKKDGSSTSKSDGPKGPDTQLGNCDPLANTGCGSGMKCTALQQSDKTLALGCDKVGDKSEGKACTQTMSDGFQTADDCDEGLACFNIGDGAGATCHKFCAYGSSNPGCPDGELCSAKISGLPDGLAFCRQVTTCSPLEQTGCASGQACYFASVSPTGGVCSKEGDKNPGDGCSSANECKSGGTCVSGKCAAFCSTESGGTPGCTGGETCTGFGVADLGYCRS